MIAESKSSPPIFKRRFKTSPPDERTDNSVIPPPKFAIKIPFSLKISMPKPTASASPLSTIRTDFAFASECRTKSQKAFFSTSVTSVGTATTYSDPQTERFFVLNKVPSNVCILSKRAITPLFIGKTTSISSGAFSYISYALSPIAKIFFLFLIAITSLSRQILSCFLSNTLISYVPSPYIFPNILTNPYFK